MQDSFAAGSQLAQSRPGVTTAVSLLTAVMATEITRIAVCNTTASSVDFSLFHDDDGNTFDQSTALHYQEPLAGNTTKYIDAAALGGGLVLQAGGQLGFQSATVNALTITVYGVTQDIAARVPRG